ncbi:amino acid adenylation domain-containing protein [Micromonospora sp. NPDC048170]|uniref:amino acid adenylation domain-containing protein n=1 Tax=Micromonospora sp. NPDC048170 TaxID=3154819 RepID=UPI0033F513CB
MSTVVDLVRQHALAAPGKTALLCGDRTVSYGELWRRAGRLAAALRDRRVGPGDLVALHGPATPEFVAAALGSWLAGAAWVPVDQQLPADRIGHLLGDSGSRLVLDTGSRRHPATTLPVADVESLTGADSGVDDEAGADAGVPGSGPSGTDLAYVIYTSGSTGTPKGVCVDHGPLALHLRHVAVDYGHVEGDVCLSFSSPSFDASIEEIWLPLVQGGVLVVRGAAMWTGPQLFDRIRGYGVTRVQCPTAYFEAFFADDLTDADVAALAGVRGIYFGGEAVSAAVVRRWSNGPLGHIPLYNTYGPTEAVITATYRRIDRGWSGGDRVPIGSAVGGHELLLLDADGHEALPGQPAELYLGGPCLARGYLGRDDLTAQRFVRLPGRDGVFYRTGDLVRLDDDGELIFLGRTDRQVKLRGFRIELEEVEAVLVGLPQVRNAVVVLDSGPQGRPRLTACVVPQGPAADELPAEVRRRMAELLPAYMVPDRVLVLAELPVGATGKIDRERVLAVTGGAR